MRACACYLRSRVPTQQLLQAGHERSWGPACWAHPLAPAGAFVVYNTGDKPVFSKSGLITTIYNKLGPEAPVYYALEGGCVGGSIGCSHRAPIGLP